MCGIAGILSFPHGPAPTRAELRSMISTLRHRGPDGFGFHASGPVGLAHARLSIIDLATGDQPISNEDGTVWCVFNGEIFNYVELREELRRAGHVFRTRSDTETIVHAYEQYGDRFVDHLNGQFAIAIWDSPRQRLVLARDRVGIRPLFFQRDGDRLLFGSEVKSLLAVSRQPARLDPEGLAQIFTFWTTVGERSAFEGIRSLPPGHMLTVEDGQQQIRKYWGWEYTPGPCRLSWEEAAEELRALLADSVRLQMRADVPVGAYLSGGLDSSIIAALARQFTGAQLRTFSITFDDAEFDESSFQAEMARHLGTRHDSVPCSLASIGENFPRLVEHVETPVIRTGPVPLMILSGLVRREGFKVVLTGEGADEVFAGYDLFKEAQIRRFWARQPVSKWRPQLLTRLYPYLRNSPVSQGAFAQSFFGKGFTDTADPFYSHRQRWLTTRRIWNFMSPEFRAQLDPSGPEEELRTLLPPGFHAMRGLHRDQWVEASTLLQGYLLSSQGDRVAMANSVEGRVPFLDHRIIEFANSLPPNYKLRGLREKAILRHASRDLLPEAINRRVKQPYRSPDCQAFFPGGKALEFVEEYLSPTRIRSAGYFEPRAVQALVQKCRAGKAIGFADNMAFVGILSTMLLHERFATRAIVSQSVPETAEVR